MRAMMFASYMSHHCTLLVIPTDNTGMDATPVSRHFFNDSNSLQPPIVVNFHDLRRFNVASAQR